MDILLSPEERSRPTTDYTDLQNISIINKATTYFKENNITKTNLQLQENIDQFYETISINKGDVYNILEKKIRFSLQINSGTPSGKVK